MNLKLVFTGVGVLALAAGTALWVGTRPPGQGPASATPVDASPATIQTARFTDATGAARTLGQFQGKVVVLNFWATWCAPCREEMPGFVRLQDRWRARGVQFVGVANDDRAKVDRFGADLSINYPLWTGGAEVMELSRRLGNRLGVLPHTVLMDREGRVLDSRVGIFKESELEVRLSSIPAKNP